MQSDNLNVFDFDGTLIKVNSFREINKKLAITLLKEFQIRSLLALTTRYILRKTHILSHLKFKQKAVEIFEKALSEQQKQNIAQSVFKNNVNKPVLEQMLKSENCIISTSAPFAYVSRICFDKQVTIIGSLDPDNRFPDIANRGLGKVENIKAHFKNNNVKITNVYTDSNDDQALVNLSINAFTVKNGTPVKIK